MSDCIAPPTSSYLEIDGFRIDKLFKWTPLENEVLDVTQRAADGTFHVVSKYQKEQFELFCPVLTEDEQATLKQILSQVGVNSLHTIVYSTPEVIRKWDNSSVAYGTVNSDIGRLRKKVYIKPWSMPHLEGHANLYECSMTCVEA